jgi:hypothetical protein
MGKPNEYYMLRRAARRLIENLFTSGQFWDRPEEIPATYEAVKVLKEAAVQIPDKLIKRRWFYEY